MQTLEPLPIEDGSACHDAGDPRTPVRAGTKRRREGTRPVALDVYPVIARQAECGELDHFLSTALSADGKSSNLARCLYVTGMPGTGKTKCVRAAATAWRSHNPAASVIEVNCMGLTNKTASGLRSFLEEHYARTVDGNVRSGRAAGFLPRLAQLGGPVIIIADEVDQLLRKGGVHSGCKADTGVEALKWLMSLPTSPESPPMAVVLIANSIDLLERIPSTAGCETVLFEAYGVEQLRQILTAEASAQGLTLSRTALELCIRRVADQNGDCRQAIRFLEQCALQEQENLIMQEEQEANISRDGTASTETPPKTRRIQQQGHSRPNPLGSIGSLPLEQQILLCALAGLKAECASITDLLRQHKSLCQLLKQRADISSKSQVATALTALEQRGLVSMRATKAGKNSSRVLQPHQLRDCFVELTVTCSMMRGWVCKANPLLARCFDQ
mmetsp:Transcript_64553/g.120157  ORF Transcript_64553/g.120157 Transcript_64553/m.120157 type:complete len:444 (+) Transcript_64553:82-1413(+)